MALSFSSCSIVKEDNTTEVIKETVVQNDALISDIDMDGISDDIDPDPYIANIPSLSITMVHKSLLGYLNRDNFNHYIFNFLDNNSLENESFLKRTLLNLSFKETRSENVDIKKIMSFNTLYSFQMQNWDTSGYVQFYKEIDEYRDSVKLNGAYLFSMFNINKKDDLFNVSDIIMDFSIVSNNKETIENLKKDNILKKNNGETVKLYADEVISSSFYSYGHGRDEFNSFFTNKKFVMTTLKDFKYSYHGNVLNFSDQQKKIQKNNAHLIILCPDGEVKQLYISPKKKITVAQALEIFSPVAYTEGRINRFFFKENHYPSLIDWRMLTDAELDLEGWTYASSNRAGLNSLIKEGEIYLVTYSSLRGLKLSATSGGGKDEQ